MCGKVLKTIGGTVAVLLLFAGPVQGQDACDLCDDTMMTEPECVPAAWYEQGNENCEAPIVGLCPDVVPDCWGNEPGGGFASVLTIRADGTMATAMPAALDLSEAQPVGLHAEVLGFSDRARIMERDCKGFVTARVYGAATVQALALRSERIVL